MSQFYKNLALWLVIGLIMIALFNVFSRPQRPTREISFSEFLDQVTEGQVQEVTIQGDDIRGVNRTGTSFRTFAPKDPELIPTLRKQGVRIQAEPPEKTSWYVNLFISWFPMLLLLGVWIFFMRQMQSGGSKALSFGKSRAKLSSEKGRKVTFKDVAGVDEAKEEVVELIEFLKTPDPNSPNPSQSVILRHQDGDAWDYAVIDHVGTKAIVEIAATQMPSSASGLMQKHDDTYVSGPSWAEFTKQLGIDGDPAKTAGSVYVVSVYRAAPGQFDALQTMLSEAPNRAVDTSSGNVLMQHLEGGAWNFLAIVRYDSWQKFATNEMNSVAQTNKKEGGWFDLRQHISFHNDTLTDRVAP